MGLLIIWSKDGIPHLLLKGTLESPGTQIRFSKAARSVSCSLFF